jgi:hypothetical protein
MVLLSAAAGLFADDWIAGAAPWLKWAVWRYASLGDGPLVLSAAFRCTN